MLHQYLPLTAPWRGLLMNGDAADVDVDVDGAEGTDWDDDDGADGVCWWNVWKKLWVDFYTLYFIHELNLELFGVIIEFYTWGGCVKTGCWCKGPVCWGGCCWNWMNWIKYGVEWIDLNLELFGIIIEFYTCDGGGGCMKEPKGCDEGMDKDGSGGCWNLWKNYKLIFIHCILWIELNLELFGVIEFYTCVGGGGKNVPACWVDGGCNWGGEGCLLLLLELNELIFTFGFKWIDFKFWCNYWISYLWNRRYKRFCRLRRLRYGLLRRMLLKLNELH